MAVQFKPPEFWNFPPFFTLQMVEETRTKQLDLWKKLILDYHATTGSYSMTPATFEWFENRNINRKLSNETISTVVGHLIRSGHAEWEDTTGGLKTTLRIFWKSPDVIGVTLYDAVNVNGLMGNVLTLYELLNEEEHSNLGLHGMDVSLLRKVLDILQTKGKCQIIYGATSEDDGVKFLSS